MDYSERGDKELGEYVLNQWGTKQSFRAMQIDNF